jgi:hypothetical protein
MTKQQHTWTAWLASLPRGQQMMAIISLLNETRRKTPMLQTLGQIRSHTLDPLRRIRTRVDIHKSA